MKNTTALSVHESESMHTLHFISKNLTDQQKEVIKLLQNKEVLLTNDVDILITCGTETKAVTQYTLHDLVKKGLIFLQTEWPFSYILSQSGETIEV